MKEASFKIYNASAGSGKTFTLVKSYLKILLSENHSDAFRNILAITFTNKAVGEMKERIIENLSDFANNNNAFAENFMFKSLCAELQVSADVLQQKAKKVLKRILHNYAFFDVSTIDKFNHRIIRTFAFDLKLPQNFEVALETDLLLKEAVDNLIANAGEDELLTQVLVDFVLEKVEDDKSWDVSKDILEASKKIVQENHYKPLALLKNKTVADFRALQKTVKADIKQLEEAIKTEAEQVLTLITANGIEFSDFSRGTLPNHFVKHKEGSHPPAGPYGNKLEENIAQGKGIYPAKLSKDKAAVIDGMLPAIGVSFNKIKNNYYHLKLLQNIYKNLVPLTVINSVQQELQKIKDDENLVLISEFNATISETIKGQPAPFIYERLGEKFRYYFIDEFQDTSEMQWQNLVPLIDSALAGETLAGNKGSLLLVGDAKQAIYRWRGGNPEQFIDLFNKEENPFVQAAENENLGTNYRSYDKVIEFNNAFFDFAKENLDNAVYKELYKLGKQQTNAKQGGLVSVQFIEPVEEKTDEELYLEATLAAILKIKDTGYSFKDVAVLTRTNRQGVQIAKTLAEAGIPIISSETLLLNNSPKIIFLNNVLRYALFPDNAEIKAKLLMYLALHQEAETIHSFISTRIELPNDDAFGAYNFKLKAFLQKPFYNAVQYAIDAFQLADASDAYLQYYLDKIIEFTEVHKEGLAAFLSYWEERGDKLSLVAPEGTNAVSLFTIHRSKGLEFPVVIYPFADDKLSGDRNQVWLPTNAEAFGGFENLLVNVTNDFAETSDQAAKVKEEIDAKSALDTLNVIYVAFTRAIAQLHIISTSKTQDSRLSGMLNAFVKKQKGEVAAYNEVFGANTFIPFTDKGDQATTAVIPFGGGVTKKEWNIVTKNGMLWDTKQEQAIEKGNLVHNILAQVTTASSLELAIDEAVTEGLIGGIEKAAIKRVIDGIINHPQLAAYFNDELYTIYNEKEIITQDGEMLRPDRLMLAGTKAVIIDYKTGAHSNKYAYQLRKYAQALTQMGFTNITKLLVYIYPELEVRVEP